MSKGKAKAWERIEFEKGGGETADRSVHRLAIRHRGCESRWVESVPVHEKTTTGETVWEGEVQVFDLVGHPKAKRAYVWSYATEGTKRRFIAVLGLPPVVDAVTAVQAAIVAQYKRTQS